MLRGFPTLRTFRAVYISSDCHNLSEQDLCCICLAQYDNDSHQAVNVTSNSKCEHVFGRHCLESWLDSTRPNKNTCPICRRMWYSQTPTSVSSPRDTDTSQVLEPPAHARNSARGRSEARVRLRATIQAHAHLQAAHNVDVARRVEDLVTSVEALETLERTGVPPLGQDVRVRLHQVQDRLQTFLERNTTTIEISRSPIVHQLSSRHDIPHITERDPRSLPDPVSAEFYQSQTPPSVLHIRFKSGPLTTREVLSMESRLSQQYNQLQASMILASDRSLRTSSPPAPSTSSRSTRTTARRHTSRQNLEAEASSYPSTRRNASVPPSSNEVRTPPAITSPPTDNNSSTPSNISESKTQVYGSRIAHHSLPNIAELEAPSPHPPPSSASPPRDRVQNSAIETARAVQRCSYTTELDRIVSLRDSEVRPRRTSSTRGFAYDVQPVGTAPQTGSAASRAERLAAIGRGGAEGGFPGMLSRMMRLSNLREFVARDRAK